MKLIEDRLRIGDRLELLVYFLLLEKSAFVCATDKRNQCNNLLLTMKTPYQDTPNSAVLL